MNECTCGKRECRCGNMKMRSKQVLQCDCDVIHSKEVEEVKAKMLGDDLIICIADFYKAMSDSTRVKILNLLEIEPLCVCDIAHILNMTKSAVSHQLKNLKEMNLVKGEKKGKEVWYALSDKHVKDVFDVSLAHILEANEDEEDC